METTASERIYCLHFARGRARQAMQDRVRKNQGLLGGRKRAWAKDFTVLFMGKEWEKQGKQFRIV